MSDDGSYAEEPETVVTLEAKEDASSEEPPMSEWSSLVIKIKQENLKKIQYEEGLYDPGSGEICTAYVAQSESAIFRHVYYKYPGIPDPGVHSALLDPPPQVIYPDDGQEYYLSICKNMHQCPVRMFHKGLLQTHNNLSYYGINPYGVRAMAMALEKNRYVTCLDLTDNWLNDDACFHLGQMLERNSTLTDLILYGCHIGPSGTRRLCQALVTNRSLKILNLGYNQIGDEGIEYLSQVIPPSSVITELDLSHNGISGKGCQFLAEALEVQNNITSLNLSCNNLYSFPSGLCNVLQLLGMNPEFQYLNLSWNSLSGPKVATGVKCVFNSKELRHVYLNNNKLSGINIITKLTGMFSKPPKMQVFDLSYNPLTQEDALLVIRKFQASKIRALHLEGVNVNDEFVNVLKHTQEERKGVVVTHGDIKMAFKPKGRDMREIVLNRIEYLAKKNKRRRVDIALVVLQKLKDKVTSINSKELCRDIKREGVLLDEDLLDAVQDLWPGEMTKKGGKTIGLVAWAEYIKRKWPDRQLPPTPPPEPEPDPLKGKDTKGKKGKID